MTTQTVVTIKEITGVSKTRSFDEALRDALTQVEKFHHSLSGADRLVVAEVTSTTFRLGGFVGEDHLEVKVAVAVA